MKQTKTVIYALLTIFLVLLISSNIYHGMTKKIEIPNLVSLDTSQLSAVGEGYGIKGYHTEINNLFNVQVNSHVTSIKLRMDMYKKGKLVKNDVVDLQANINQLKHNVQTKEDKEKGITRIQYFFLKYIHLSNPQNNIYGIVRIAGQNKAEINFDNKVTKDIYPDSEPLLKQSLLPIGKEMNIMILTLSGQEENNNAKVFRFQQNPQKMEEFQNIEKAYIVSVEAIA